MPELPEVETISNDLQVLVNKKITDIKVYDTKILGAADINIFNAELLGKTVRRIFRRGKHLIVKLSSNKFLVIHLRMTGQLVLGKLLAGSRIAFRFSIFEKKTNPPSSPFARIGQWLNFVDQRRFGTMDLVEDWQKIKALKEMGPEPFSDEFDWTFLRKIFAKHKTKVKSLLIDQRLIAGIGNIYVQEALFLAGIKPQRLAKSLSDKEIKKLARSIKFVLKKAIRYRGSSVDNYVNGYGQKGEAHLHLYVYGQAGQPCSHCQTKLRDIKISGRNTVYCPNCQK